MGKFACLIKFDALYSPLTFFAEYHINYFVPKHTKTCDLYDECLHFREHDNLS